MVKTNTNNVTKSKKEIEKSYKSGNNKTAHPKSILNLFSKRFQKLLLKVSFLLLGILLAFAILEVSLRLLEKKSYGLSACTSLDKDFHHVMILNSTCRFKTDEWDVTYKINNLGLRENEIEEKKPQEFRILLLGDSFVQGHGVELAKTFGKVLENKLNNASMGKYRVINSGVYGYSPLLEYLYLKKKGLDLKPDLVLLAFDLTDFWEDRQRFDELKKSYPELSDKELKVKIASGEAQFNFEQINTAAAPSSSTKIVLPSVSYSFKTFLRKNFKIYGTFADFVKKQDPQAQQDAMYQGNIDKDIAAIMRGNKITDDNWQKLWETPIENIKLIDELLKEKNIPFMVLGIPDAVQVSDREWPGRIGLGYPQNFTDPRGPFQDELSKRLGNFNISFVNMLENFQKSSAFPLYFNQDGHWRESGHNLAAEIIYNYLKNSNYLK